MKTFPSFVFIDDTSLQRVSMENVIRSEMEVGPQKTRPIQSVPLFQVSMDVSLCDPKLIDWRIWWRDINYGSNWFLMNDPFDGTVRRFRFVDTEIVWNKSGNIYRSSFVLEAYDEL